ncbi:MAG: HD-GYP domain-containing protein [Rubrobacteraceae bacterium]
MSGRESVDGDALIKHGIFRISLAGVVGIVLFEFFEAASFAYLGIFLSLAFGALLISGRPAEFLEDGLARLLMDVFCVTLVVAGVGGAESPFFLLFFIAAFGIAWTGSSFRSGIGVAGVMAGYLAAVSVSGIETLLDAGGFLRFALLVVFSGLAWVMSGEVESEKERSRELSESLSVERDYSESVSALAMNFGSVLAVLDLRRILGWTVETARDLTGASFAHAVLLDGNQHRTSLRTDSDKCPTWWHPAIQELVLHGSRKKEPLHEKDKEIHGVSGFLAMPFEVAGSEHNGTLILGGGEFGEREERMLSLLAGQAARALRGSGEAPGGRDPATGLPNKASLHKVLRKEMKYDGSVTVISVRIEGLWGYGRSQSLAVGEALLRRITERIGERQRVFRYGMDELVVLMRGGNGRRAERASAWIHDVAREISGSYPLSPKISVSYAAAHSDESTPERLIAEARKASPEAGSKPRISPSNTIPEASDGIVAALLEAATIKDFELNAHLRSVRRLSRLIATKMGLGEEEVRVLSLGALLHDVGKIGVPDDILKKPGSLTEAEFDEIKRHTIMGASVIAQIPTLADIVPIIRHHHEHFDGRGYPDGLRGDDIPHLARIVSVADAYDSMVRDRPYRKGLTHEAALEEIENNAGTQFAPDISRTFVKVMREADRMSG